MAFPFLPGGAIVAAAVLFSAIAGFVAGMMAMDRAATRVFGGVVSGVVSGARRWRDGSSATRRTPSDEPRPITTAVLDSVPVRPAAPTPPPRWTTRPAPGSRAWCWMNPSSPSTRSSPWTACGRG